MRSRRSRGGVIDVSGYPLIPYARNSKPSKRRKVVSVETQDFFIRDHCEEAGELLYDGPTIVDPDMGAAFDAEDRPGWLRVMKLLETCQYGGIAVRDADRAARDGWIGEQVIRLVRQRNLKGFRVVSPIVTYDLSTQEGASEFRKAIDDAEKEVDRIRRRTAQALRHKAMVGEPTSGQRRVFGWLDKPNGVHEPSEAAAILQASLQVVSEPDFSMADLVDEWADQGIVTINGLPFTHSKIKEILLRPSNAGAITASGSERGHLPGEPIVSNELYREVVAYFAANNRGRPPSQQYLMNRLNILRCSRCKSRMSGGKPHSKAKLAYICTHNSSAHKRRGCKRSVQMAGVDAFVAEKTLAWWKDPQRAVRDHLYVLQTSPEERRLRTQIDMVDERLVSLTTKLDLPTERYEYAVQVLQDRKAKLSAKLAELQKPAKIKEVTSAHVDRLWNSSWESQRKMIKAAIRTIWVDAHVPRKGVRRSFQPERLRVEYW
ncbi:MULTISPECIES: recombinase family protein [unclassified Nocardiopsis]|uniref:recombinase family protein n=1 Tax=unclassified Nocardiopsis TaxID=2649073 RepID=UPI001359B85E|nr:MULTISPECIES: recombinase family protein [unclassified Nocardiopsis]